MARTDFTYSAPFGQKANTQIAQSNIAFVLPDGVHDFDDPIDRYCVVVGGEIVNYATFWSPATHQYKEACRVRREHRRNLLNLELPL